MTDIIIIIGIVAIIVMILLLHRDHQKMIDAIMDKLRSRK